ncbi:MAG: hypothetical protein SW833_24780 [Cyanobacteriota bacterium]|nr:hypothetical protein [Cyanobacteriota bacterium]
MDCAVGDRAHFSSIVCFWAFMIGNGELGMGNWELVLDPTLTFLWKILKFEEFCQMMKSLSTLLVATASATFGLTTLEEANAAVFNASLTKLPGLTGGSPAQTAVYVADLSSISFDIQSIQISDNSSRLGGAPGKFSAFDLDGIKLSNTLVTNAADINSLPSLK